MEITAQINLEAETREDIEHMIEQIEFQHNISNEAIEIIESPLLDAAPDLLEALEQLQEAFVHIPNDMKGNRHRSGIIKHCENMRVALNVARCAVDKAAIAKAE